MMWHRTSPIHVEQEGGIYVPDQGQPVSVTVHEPEEVDTFSGLYDAEGNPLHRQKPRIGFI